MDAGVTPPQGRVVFHMERLFKSAGGSGMKAHKVFIALSVRNNLPIRVSDMTTEQCVLACQLIECACRRTKMHLVRDVGTGWQQLLH